MSVTGSLTPNGAVTTQVKLVELLRDVVGGSTSVTFGRDDEDWLRAQGIAPYSEAEIASAREALTEICTVLAEASASVCAAITNAATVLAGLVDELIAADIDTDCEAATLLDPGAPLAIGGAG